MSILNIYVLTQLLVEQILRKYYFSSKFEKTTIFKLSVTIP